MASDYDIDLDWDNDPFGGDMDFDMDFNPDPFKGKGFLQSVGSGFLSGVGDAVGLGEAGSGRTAARFRMMRTLLPDTFTNALDKAYFLNDRLDELKQEFKEENYESAKALQNIASKLNSKMGEKLPGFVRGGLDNFSSKDFSQWEKYEARSDRFSDRIDSTTEDDVGYAVDGAESSQSSMFASLGESLNSMTAAATGVLQASIGAGNRQLVNIESSLRDLLNYQRNVDARLQQAQLNIAARTYVNNAKFYKFMEAGIHAEVAELKKITKYTGMSDFEKTSTYTASKSYMRQKLFSTVGNRLGGLTGALREKFSGENRKEAYGTFGTLIGGVSDAMEMGEGSLSRGMIGNILGKMMGEVAVDKLPYFFKRGPGKKAIDKLTKAYPEQAEYINQQVARLADLGNVVSYASTSGAGMLNYMAQNYQPMDEMKYVDYEHYLSELPPDKTPLPKAVWTVMNSAANRGKEAINKLMNDTTKARGTQYTLKRRNVNDLNQPGIWKEMNNTTLNEVLPGLITRTNQILEKMRTGSDEVEQVGYNYMRGEFQSESKRKISVQADLMPHGEFQRYAQASLELVDSVDPEKTLSAATRKAFALRVAKDIDAEMGFNPYYYLGDIEGMSPSMQKEVHAMLKRHFGISTEDVSRYNSSDSFERMKQMAKMPTEEGRARLNSVSASAANLKANFPNVAERIDLLRATGNEQMLRDLGVIYTEDGKDKINIQAFHDRIGQYMDDPNNPLLRGVTPTDAKPLPTRNGFGNTGPGSSGSAPVVDNAPVVSSMDGINETLKLLNEQMGKITQNTGAGSAANINLDGVTTLLTELRDSNAGVFEKSTSIDDQMRQFLELAKKGKLVMGEGDPREERDEENAKKSFMDKIKGFLPTGLMGKGMDLITKNNPLVLGGLIGSVAAAATGHNPIIGLAMAGGGLALNAAWKMWKNRGASTDTASGEDPNDDEDILDESGEPLLKAAKRKAGEYIDATTRRVIKTWNDVRGPVIDTVTRTVIGARELAGKIFGADGRAVALRGLQKVRDAALGAWNMADPLGRIRSLIDSGKELVYQQDVYIKGQKEPVLRAVKFKAGEYFVRDESGNFKPISGWNEIDGPVYDEQGNQLVSELEYQSGLVTAAGVAVRNLGSGVANTVGAAAGMARAGLNSVLGRFGYQRDGNPGDATPGSGGASAGAGISLSGVEHRLDLIYKMLSDHFGIPMDTTGLGEAARSAATGGSNGLRLNSLEWKEKAAKEEEKHKVNQAIIDIAENTKELGGEKDAKGESTGFFGKIKDLFLGLGSFGMKLIKNPLGTLGGLVFGSLTNSVGRLAKIGSALFSGVLGVASPIFKLMKWGFGKIAGGLGGGGGDDNIFDNGAEGGGEEGGRRNRNRRRNRGGRRRRSFIPRGLIQAGKGAALAYAGAKATDWLMGGDEDEPEFNTGTEDLSAGERDEATGRYKTNSDGVVDAVSSWLPQGMLANSLVSGILGKEKKEELDNIGLFWTSDGSFFMSRQKRDAAQAILDGKTPVNAGPAMQKSNTQITLQKKIRLAMYGVRNSDSNLARRVMALELQLYPYVTIRDGRAALKPETPTGQLVNDFITSGLVKDLDKGAVENWFMSRFKPVFMIFNAAVAMGKMGDIAEFDNSKSYDAVEVIEKVQRSIASFNPPPYSIDVRIDDKEGTMGLEHTRATIAELFEELKKAIPSPPSKIKEIRQKAQSARKQESGQTLSEAMSLPGMVSQPGIEGEAARSAQKAVNQGSDKPADVATIDISDLLGDSRTLDPFTLARLAVYGNIEGMPWRVEAVLRLERYMESFIMIMGKDARFTGKTGEVMEQFKASFRLHNTFSQNNWAIWFRDRFLPTLMEYCKQVYAVRGGMPGKSWKSLSATNRAMIARKLTTLLISTKDKQVPVWSIEAGPFPGTTSGIWPDRADKYLKALDNKAQEAKLKDPELEDERSRASAGVKDEIEHRAQNASKSSTGGTNDQSRSILESVFGKGSTGSGGFAGGFGGAPASGGYTPNATMSAPGGAAGSAGAFMGKANDNFNPEFIKKAGADKGIKMTLEQGDQLMLNHLVKAGFRDNKTLALALAMARKETGGYQSTVENTNWSAPTLLKYFKNVPDAATAQKVAAMSPVERAMWVYGRAPKGPQLGNQKPEDGWTYRGRGLFQLTGKANYEAFKKASGIDVVSHPELVSEDPNVMAESAIWYLKNNAAMRSIAKTGDFDTAVRGINGGNAVPATDERRAFYNDYLNKLRSGDLTIPGGGDTGEGSETQKGDAAALAAGQQPTVPEGADKNVPADKMTVVKGGEINKLLDQAEQSQAASNAGNTAPAANSVSAPAPTPASTGGSSSDAPAPAADTSGPVNSSGPVSATVEAPKREPVKSAVQARNEAAAAEAAAKPPTVNLPEHMSVSDKTNAEIGGTTVKILSEIRDILKSGSEHKPLVNL